MENKPNWEVEFDKRFVWAHTAEGRGYLLDTYGEQSVDEVIMKDYIQGVIAQAREDGKDKWYTKGFNDALLTVNRRMKEAKEEERSRIVLICEGTKCLECACVHPTSVMNRCKYCKLVSKDARTANEALDSLLSKLKV